MLCLVGCEVGQYLSTVVVCCHRSTNTVSGNELAGEAPDSVSRFPKLGYEDKEVLCSFAWRLGSFPAKFVVGKSRCTFMHLCLHANIRTDVLS